MFKGVNIHKFMIFLLIVAAMPWLVVCDDALADNIRPAYLDIEEFEAGAFRVVWKVPLNQIVPARFRPSFPEHFKVTSPKKRVKTPNAAIETWTMVCGFNWLTGHCIAPSCAPRREVQRFLL